MDAIPAASFTFEGHPGRTLGVWLFKDVTNSKELQEMVVAGNINPELALLDATVVPDLFVLQLGAFKALTAEVRGRRRTRSLHAELVVDVSGSKHIKESLTRFGISESTRHLLVARFDPCSADGEFVAGLVKGQQVMLEELPSLSNPALLTKYYKISPQESKIGTVADAITCRIAARDC